MTTPEGNDALRDEINTLRETLAQIADHAGDVHYGTLRVWATAALARSPQAVKVVAGPPPTPEGLEAARVEQMRMLRDWAHDCADTSEATAKARSNGDDYDQDIAPSFAARGRAFRECADRINGLLALPVPGQSRPAQPPEGLPKGGH
jgi:hypothetical protein